MAEPLSMFEAEVRDHARAAPVRPALKHLFSLYLTRPLARAMPAAVTIAVVAALAIGWVQSDEGHLTPDSGAGYWLGIVGASAMLLLLVYPLRKRMPRLRFLGSVPFWFRTHMMLGIAGPLLIVFHSNFKLGALNSNVAFVSMLIVAASGVVGRYIYGKVHLGLNGRMAAVRQILDDAAQMQSSIDGELRGGAEVIKQMSAFADAAMAPRSSATASLLSMLVLGVRSQILRRRLARQVREMLVVEAKARRWSRRQRRDHEAQIGDLLEAYFTAVNKAAKFELFERLFALWHVLHLPLFFLLIGAALVHIFAVHFY